VLSALILLGLTAEVQAAGDYVSLSLTSTQNTDNPDLRGFDPGIIASHDDPFPDTSQPVGLIGSTMFGSGVPSGNTRNEVNQNCSTVLGFTGEHPPSFPTFNTTSCVPPVTSSVIHNEFAFQSSRNGLLSRRSTATTACDILGTTADDRRCNEITFGFLQDVQEQGQVMDLNFALRSLTDADGNLIGAAQGTFTQSVTENGVTTACSGTFTFDEQNGFVMTSGPLHEC
jgi:hypothetical protein